MIPILIMFLIVINGITIVSVSDANAKEDPVKIGNPHDFRPGPPIPSCNADFHQGPPDDDIKGCRDSPAP